MRSLLLVVAASLSVFAGCAEAPTDGDVPGSGTKTPDCAQTPYATGCETKKPAKTSTSTDEVTSKETDAKEAGDRACVAKTCEDFGGACGEHDDGCGGTFKCGECTTKNPDCKPKTCDDLGLTCGTGDDACGGKVSCGTCATACATDAKEPNDTKAQAIDLGAFADTEDKTVEVKSLASADGDEDWFKLEVSDKGFGSNPTIEATATDAKLEVSVFHECTSLPNYSYCYAQGKQDNEVGFGCTNMGSTTLKTDCKGTNEAGNAYVRVRKGANDKSCHSYDLKVFVY